MYVCRCRGCASVPHSSLPRLLQGRNNAPYIITYFIFPPIILGQFIPGKGLKNREENLLAANPALETFKGRKATKGQFIPGKGLRSREENLLAINPALETFKGGKKTKGAFIPGKGLRLSESFDTLMG